MLRVKNITGGTKTIFGSQYLGGLTYEVDERLLEFFIKNGFEILDSVEAESAPVEETVVEAAPDAKKPADEAKPALKEGDAGWTSEGDDDDWDDDWD